MPVNQNALQRYRILNDCFRRRQRHWHLEDLCDEVTRRLVDHTGKNAISPSTINTDIRAMRPDGKSGYNAPIVCDRSEGRGFYYYSDPDFSIEQTPVTSDDVAVVRQVLAVLAPFRGLPLLDELTRVADQLSERTGAAPDSAPAVLHFDTVPDYTGAAWLGPLYEAIRGQQVVRFRYKPFQKDESAETVHPYLLKQYNHRWFLLGRCASLNQLRNYALDRIQGERIETLLTLPFQTNDLLDPTSYFDNVIGASVPEGGAVADVQLRFSPSRAPYVLTKPLHPSQQEGATTEVGTEITLRVGLNRELTSLLLSFGEDVEVLTPESLRTEMGQKIGAAASRYA